MVALASVVVVVIVSLLITRVATVALVLTGMSREAARFQARSALSGVGFTTSAAESIVEHPVRRRIAMWLMLAGSAGIVTAVATLMVSFANADRTEFLLRIAVLLPALAAVYALSLSRRVDRWLSALIARGLERWTDLQARDYAALMHFSDDYAVIELAVGEGDWLAARPLRELDLRAEGIVLLGIERADGGYVGAPGWDEQLRAGDVAILYGRRAEVCALDQRPA